MSDRPHMPDEMDLRAAEYVLGLLDGPDEAQATEQLRTDATFAKAVEHWRQRFSELDFTAAEGAGDPALLARILATLDGEAPETQAAGAQTTRLHVGPDTLKSSAPPPRAAPRARAESPISRLWQSLGFWRSTGFAGAAATLLLALGIAFGPFAAPPQPKLVAVLMGPQGEPAAVVNAYGDGTADLIPLRPISVPDGRVLEVWTLWDPARGPVSIGLAGEARRIKLDLKNLPRTGPDQLFEITLEPKGGSPIGRPTGPILMKGTTSVAL
ncbi:anti-sigma factor [Aquabacter cavernae]|uniref:anti-sigma factor n=1 Tax=Aquabacter cavernae TaxID=2496029 RepID=UPI001FE092BB|nr:anti-sigma factor [Aquabacter cavernae]